MIRREKGVQHLSFSFFIVQSTFGNHQGLSGKIEQFRVEVKDIREKSRHFRELKCKFGKENTTLGKEITTLGKENTTLGKESTILGKGKDKVYFFSMQELFVFKHIIKHLVHLR